MTLTLAKGCKIDRPSIVYHQVTTGKMGASRRNPLCNLFNIFCPNIPLRFIMISLIILATSIDYITRVNINIAIVTMVSFNSSHSSVQRSTCPVKQSTVTIESTQLHHDTEYPGQHFDWSPTVQGIILGSFWYSYILMQVPSGRMAEEFGGKTIVAISLIGSGLVNLITPLVASSVSLLVVSRMALGFIQGGIFPSCYAIIGRWLPLRERSLGFAFMEIGATIGSVIATTSSGYLSEHGPAGGWPSVFYVSGVISLLAFILWYSYAQSEPLHHPDISEDELKYIQCNDLYDITTDGQNNRLNCNEDNGNNCTTLAGGDTSSTSTLSPLPASTFSTYDSSLHLTSRCDVKSVIVSGALPQSRTGGYGITDSQTSLNSTPNRSPSSLSNRPSVPWRLIITSPAVISILVSKFSLSFSYFTLLSKLPSYLHDVLHIPPTQNGLLNASLYMTTCISLLTSSHVSERIINQRILTRTACRKVFLATASIGTALCFSFIPWAGCDTNTVMILLLIGNFFLGINAGGDVPVPGEITSNFPATIYAMGNMFGCSTGFIAPYVIGVILESGGTAAGSSSENDLIFLWSKVYYLAAGIAIIGAVIFVTFGSAERQAWDDVPEDMHQLREYFGSSTASVASDASCSGGGHVKSSTSTIYQSKRIQ